MTVPVMRLWAEVSLPENCPGPDLGQLLSRVLEAAEKDFPSVVSIERGKSEKTEGSVKLSFGMSLAAEVKHE